MCGSFRARHGWSTRKMQPHIAPAEDGSIVEYPHQVRPQAVPAGYRGIVATCEILMFNSGGGGARANLDGLHATAFPSGVHAVSVEASEQTGPSSYGGRNCGEGSARRRHRGGLGQIIEISPREGTRCNQRDVRSGRSSRSRRAAAATEAPARFPLDDGTPMKSKGRQSLRGSATNAGIAWWGGFGPPKIEIQPFGSDLELGYVPSKNEDASSARTPNAVVWIDHALRQLKDQKTMPFSSHTFDRSLRCLAIYFGSMSLP